MFGRLLAGRRHRGEAAAGAPATGAEQRQPPAAQPGPPGWTTLAPLRPVSGRPPASGHSVDFVRSLTSRTVVEPTLRPPEHLVVPHGGGRVQGLTSVVARAVEADPPPVQPTAPPSTDDGGRWRGGFRAALGLSRSSREAQPPAAPTPGEPVPSGPVAPGPVAPDSPRAESTSAEPSPASSAAQLPSPDLSAGGGGSTPSTAVGSNVGGPVVRPVVDPTPLRSAGATVQVSRQTTAGAPTGTPDSRTGVVAPGRSTRVPRLPIAPAGPPAAGERGVVVAQRASAAMPSPDAGGPAPAGPGGPTPDSPSAHRADPLAHDTDPSASPAGLSASHAGLSPSHAGLSAPHAGLSVQRAGTSASHAAAREPEGVTRVQRADATAQRAGQPAEPTSTPRPVGPPQPANHLQPAGPLQPANQLQPAGPLQPANRLRPANPPLPVVPTAQRAVPAGGPAVPVARRAVPVAQGPVQPGRRAAPVSGQGVPVAQRSAAGATEADAPPPTTDIADHGADASQWDSPAVVEPATRTSSGPVISRDPAAAFESAGPAPAAETATPRQPTGSGTGRANRPLGLGRPISGAVVQRRPAAAATDAPTAAPVPTDGRSTAPGVPAPTAPAPSAPRTAPAGTSFWPPVLPSPTVQRTARGESSGGPAAAESGPAQTPGTEQPAPGVPSATGGSADLAWLRPVVDAGAAAPPHAPQGRPGAPVTVSRQPAAGFPPSGRPPRGRTVARAQAGPRAEDPGELAVAAGLATRDTDGSVVFAPPQGPPAVVQRQPQPPPVAVPQPPAAATSAVPAAVRAAPSVIAAAPAAAPDPAELADQVYERVERRLRMELFLERERRGGLIDL